MSCGYNQLAQEIIIYSSAFNWILIISLSGFEIHPVVLC